MKMPRRRGSSGPANGGCRDPSFCWRVSEQRERGTDCTRTVPVSSSSGLYFCIPFSSTSGQRWRQNGYGPPGPWNHHHHRRAGSLSVRLLGRVPSGSGMCRLGINHRLRPSHTRPSTVASHHYLPLPRLRPSHQQQLFPASSTRLLYPRQLLPSAMCSTASCRTSPVCSPASQAFSQPAASTSTVSSFATPKSRTSVA